jgi:hypothetical protein
MSLQWAYWIYKKHPHLVQLLQLHRAKGAIGFRCRQ